MQEIKDVIETFLSEPGYNRLFKYMKIEKTTVKNIFKLFEKNYSGISLDADMTNFAIKETVKSYMSNKKTALAVFERYLVFLEKEYAFKTDICFLEIDISNSLERQMYIVKAN